MLKHFKVNKERDVLFPEFKCYQMDLSGPVEKAIKAGEVDEKFRELPSWQKFAAHPIKSKGFFSRVLKAVFLGQGGHDELNVDLQTENYGKNGRVAMMFMSANIRNDNLKTVGEIAKESLDGYEIIVLSGAVTHNGRRITNRNAERTVKEVIEQNHNVLIISAQLAQRSFSIPEITELYLAYDKGENGATIQKMSRALTPGNVDKVGNIFSLSFDPNRDDKFDAMIVETALNYKKRYKVKSLQEALRDVLRTVDIFECSENGAVKMHIDVYLQRAMERKGITRVLGKIADMSKLSEKDIKALASGNVDYIRNELVKRTKSGKTRLPSKVPRLASKKKSKDEEKAREVIVSILDNIDLIIHGTNSKTIDEALDKISLDYDFCTGIEKVFGVPFETIFYLFDNEVINKDWIELYYDNA